MKLRSIIRRITRKIHLKISLIIQFNIYLYKRYKKYDILNSIFGDICISKKCFLYPNTQNLNNQNPLSLLLNQRHNLTTVLDTHHLWDLTVLSTTLLNESNHVHSLQDTSENNMLIVKVRRRIGRYKELTAVGILSRVCHGQNARLVMLVLEGFVLELITVDAWTTCTIRLFKISTLILKKKIWVY